MKILINLLWIYPAIILTVWTLLTFLVMRAMPLSRPISHLFAAHPMAMMYNPKDNMLYQRPSRLTGLVFLIGGLVPVVNVLSLMAVLAIALTASLSHAKSKSRKKLT